MCGIAGALQVKLTREETVSLLGRFESSMRHRGPDDHGLFLSTNCVAGLVSTRLAILDLSPAGNQPMSSGNGRLHIAFNGEIYNFESLRSELAAEGAIFRSHSDTEVVLKLYERYGAECVRELEGMFAFAIWDEQERTCFVARDPLGIKPVYYYQHNETLLFASELRTLLASELVPRRCSSTALAGYLLTGTVPEPETLIDNIKILPAGHHLLWRDGKTKLQRYWDIQFGFDSLNGEDAPEIVRSALIESIDRHLVSDVPVGVFLSGGIDSTAIAGLASKRIRENLHTFCISFENPAFDEGAIAAKTAEHFGAKHTDWGLDSRAAKALLHDFLAASDQPSIDGFNTFCVSKLAHDHGYKVILSGLGGDELFGGYRSFDIVPRMVGTSRSLQIASLLRAAAGRTLEVLPFSPPTKRLGSFLQAPPYTAIAYWAMRGIFTPREVERLLPRYCPNENDFSIVTDASLPMQPTLADEISYLELTRYMRNQLLRDSDVMSMAWSMELRVPFVDRKLVETVAAIPAQTRLATGKRLLLDAIQEIPQWVRNRPKQGFTFPFQEWMTAEWKEVFQQIERDSPVRLQNWYRCWCLFALEHFLQRHGIEPRTE